MNVTIRTATAADAHEVQRCADEAYAPYVARIGRRPAPMTADFAGQIALGRVRVAVDATDAILGYAALLLTADGDALLESVAVFAAARGRGVGRALITRCEDDARAHGAAGLALYTNAAMVENLTLYPRLGYAEAARRREDGFDRVFFRKSLN